MGAPTVEGALNERVLVLGGVVVPHLDDLKLVHLAHPVVFESAFIVCH